VKNVVFVGSHLGYPMDRTPLGGGAMVGLQLARRWLADPHKEPFGLKLLGSGPLTPDPAADYVRLAGCDAPLESLSELAYARFCRRFERETTDWILARRAELPPAETCVVVNDISEGPTLAELAGAGYPIVSIWHVDVVDYFNKLYLKRVVAPETLTKLYEGGRRLGASRLIPDVLSLVFEKQRETVAHSRRLILPSRAMADTVRRCYGDLGTSEPFGARAVVVPWGVFSEPVDEARAAAEAVKLRRHYELGDKTEVVLTLSRISPEKGLHVLLEALSRLEREGKFAGRDVALFICGEAAFMQGRAYERRVKDLAERLGAVRVFFPGYLAAQEKRAFFKLARLFVSPSLHESYGLNVVEAMDAGLPILASDHYGVRDLLDESFGVRVPYSSASRAPAELAHALDALLKDPERLAIMGRRARERAAAMPFSKASERVLAEALSLCRSAAGAVAR
jgi:glycosyltransferase involved in cell wall biosynthesis